MAEVFIIKDFGSAVAEAHRLEGGARAANELLPVMTEIALDMLRIEKIVFDSQGRRGGGQWKPLKPDTIKRKGGNSKILVDTGALVASLTELNAPYQILNVSNSMVEFGTDHPVAEFHDLGRGNNPRRPLMKWVPGDARRWNKMITDRLMAPHRV